MEYFVKNYTAVWLVFSSLSAPGHVSVECGSVPTMYTPTVYLRGWCSYFYLILGEMEARFLTLMWVEPVCMVVVTVERYTVRAAPSTMPGVHTLQCLLLLLNWGRMENKLSNFICLMCSWNFKWSNNQHLHTTLCMKHVSIHYLA